MSAAPTIDPEELREAIDARNPDKYQVDRMRRAADLYLKQRNALAVARVALESCDDGDYSTGHVIYPNFDRAAIDQAIATIDALNTEPETTA